MYFKEPCRSRIEAKIGEKHSTGFEDKKNNNFRSLSFGNPFTAAADSVWDRRHQGSFKAAASSNHVRYVNAFLLGDVCTVYHRYIHTG